MKSVLLVLLLIALLAGFTGCSSGTQVQGSGTVGTGGTSGSGGVAGNNVIVQVESLSEKPGVSAVSMVFDEVSLKTASGELKPLAANKKLDGYSGELARARLEPGQYSTLRLKISRVQLVSNSITGFENAVTPALDFEVPINALVEENVMLLETS